MNKVLNVILTPLAIALLLVLTATPTAMAVEQGGMFPDFTVEGDLSKAQLDYLEADQPKITLSSIPADWLFIEVFSMYCPICQREAPALNELYKKTKKYKTLRMIGVATGNTPFEVQFFRDEYDVPFPLFHDEEFVVNKGLGEIGTPYFVLVKNNGPGKLETVYIHEGAVEDMDAFWSDVLSAAGLK